MTRTRIINENKQGGVTLIEILVVLSIIMILASITIASISILKTRAKRNAAESLLNGLSMAIEQFEADNMPRHIKDTDGPYVRFDPYHGIKNLRVALSGDYKCPNCGYVYDPYVYVEWYVDDKKIGVVPNVPFNGLMSLKPDWECPKCATPGGRFVRGKNYIEWITPDKIGHGVLDIDLNHDDRDEHKNPDGSYQMPEKDADVWGAILDPWGQPLIYYSQFDKDESPDAWLAHTGMSYTAIVGGWDSGSLTMTVQGGGDPFRDWDLRDYYLCITKCSHTPSVQGEVRRITANDIATITVDSAWEHGAPQAGDEFGVTELRHSDEILLKVSGQYVLCSYGPD